jgi:hypothetical protein
MGHQEPFFVGSVKVHDLEAQVTSYDHGRTRIKCLRDGGVLWIDVIDEEQTSVAYIDYTSW